jgi:hypothetical protein
VRGLHHVVIMFETEPASRIAAIRAPAVWIERDE